MLQPELHPMLDEMVEDYRFAALNRLGARLKFRGKILIANERRITDDRIKRGLVSSHGADGPRQEICRLDLRVTEVCSSGFYACLFCFDRIKLKAMNVR